MKPVSSKSIEIHSRQMGAREQTHQHVFPLRSCVRLQSQALPVWLSAPVGSGFVIPSKILSTSWTAHKWHHCGDDGWKNSCLACFSSVLLCCPFLARRPQEIHRKSYLPRKISCFLLRTRGSASLTGLWANWKRIIFRRKWLKLQCLRHWRPQWTKTQLVGLIKCRWYFGQGC